MNIGCQVGVGCAAGLGAPGRKRHLSSTKPFQDRPILASGCGAVNEKKRRMQGRCLLDRQSVSTTKTPRLQEVRIPRGRERGRLRGSRSSHSLGRYMLAQATRFRTSWPSLLKNRLRSTIKSTGTAPPTISNRQESPLCIEIRRAIIQMLPNTAPIATPGA